MKIFRVLTVALVALVVAAGAGCGGDGDDEESPAPTDTGNGATEPTGGAQTTTVKMDEYSFDPKDATVKRNATITVDNAGQIAHNLTIEQGPDPKEETKELAGTSTFLGGKSEKLEVDVKPGKYAMVCTVAGHRELGMTGTITVE
jgi:nitrite reductase (NO-forming)